MKRTKLDDRILPAYTKGEEICNMTTHTIGVGLSIIAIILLPIFAAKNHNPLGVVGRINFCHFNVNFILYVKYISWLKSKIKRQKSFSGIGPLCYFLTNCRFIYSYVFMYIKKI